MAAKKTKTANSQFPLGWNEERVRRLLSHYEGQTETEAAAEYEAATRGPQKK